MTLTQQFGTAIFLVLLSLSLVCVGAAALIIWLRDVPKRDLQNVRLFHSAALVLQTAVAVILLHGLVILLWAGCHRSLCFPTWESAFYFSASTYVTVGSDGVVLPSKWRLLDPLESMVGMLMAGLSVGLLFAAVTHLLDGESQHGTREVVRA